MYFGCLDLYLAVWTCTCASGLVFGVSTHHPVVYVLAAGAFIFLENDAPGIFERILWI